MIHDLWHTDHGSDLLRASFDQMDGHAGAIHCAVHKNCPIAQPQAPENLASLPAIPDSVVTKLPNRPDTPLP